MKRWRGIRIYLKHNGRRGFCIALWDGKWPNWWYLQLGFGHGICWRLGRFAVYDSKAGHA